MIEILNEDCMELMSLYEDNYFDLAVVDPPYGINVNVSMGRRKGNKKSDYHKFHGNDTSPPDKEYFLELKRVSKNQIIWGGNHFIDRIENPNSSCWLMWDKKFSGEVTFSQFELAWTSFLTTCKKFEQSPNDKNRIHPTQKPVKLYEWILTNYAKKGQKILDTHLGSGSSAIAAHYFGVDFVGCELDKEYYDMAVNRFNESTKQTTLFDL